MHRTHVLVLLLASLLMAGCSSDESAEAEPSPYAGQENREIKALSAQEIGGYLEGRGMGFSKVAELNHYPGPKHVLDLSRKLGLTEEQHRQVKAAFRDMKSKARKIGRRLVEKERRLDALFANKKVSKPEVRALIQEIGALKADLRFTHVQAHIQMRAVLTRQQVRAYDELRGYGKTEEVRHQHHHRGA